MQRLRIVCPGGLTGATHAVLQSDPAVTSLTCVRGVALDPIGDVIEADIAREAVDDVVVRLRDLGLQHHGTIQLQPVATWLSRSGYDAQRRTPGSSADAVVWVDVTQRACEES